MPFHCFRAPSAAVLRAFILLAWGGVLWLLAGAFIGNARAQAEGAEQATPHVSARLLADARAVAPGERVTLGVHKQIIPGWHTYWRNPGDSGLATEIAWQLPADTRAGDILWPAPQRHAFGPVMNYGYEDTVTLLTELQLSNDLQPGNTFAVQATVDWLVCEDTCIPEQVTLSLELPVEARTRRDGHPAIDAARSRLPQPAPWRSGFARDGGLLGLAVDSGPLPSGNAEIWFYPLEWGMVEHAAAQVREDTAQGFLLKLTPGQALSARQDRLEGVLVISEQQGDERRVSAFQIDAPAIDTLPASTPVRTANAGRTLPEPGLGSALLLAVAGGLLLNLMPCVFPVLAIKVLALVRHAGAQPGAMRAHGLAYLAGVLASFALLALVVLLLQAGGMRLGWGFQFQSPLFVVLMAWLLFVVGLNLSGVFEIGGGLAGVGHALTTRSGYSGSFFTGVLATVVATPCTAPFMGAAIGFSMTQPAPILLLGFLALGFGLALPFVLLAWFPAATARLPRPGPWMTHFRQLLAFPMYAAAIWLVWVLTLQTGASGVVLALGGMLALALAAWLHGLSWHSPSRLRHASRALSLLMVAGAVLFAVRGTPENTPAPAANLANPATTAGSGPAFEAFSEARLNELRARGEAVFVNFTAAWCITCLVNEQVAINQAAVAEAFARHRVHYLKGDWTHRNREITAMLARFGRSGVPLYLYYPPQVDSEPQVLPQILTPDSVLRILAQPTAD